MKKFLILWLCVALLTLPLIAQSEEVIIVSSETDSSDSDSIGIEAPDADLNEKDIQEVGDVLLVDDANDNPDTLQPDEETNNNDPEDESSEQEIAQNGSSVVYYEDCVYKVIKPFSLRAEPSQDSKTVSGQLNNGQTIRVVAVVRNDYNNMWLKTDSGGYIFGGFRWDGSKWYKDGDQYVEYVSKNTNFTWSDNNIAGKTIPYGQPYNLSGTIRSSFTMHNIIGALYDGDTWKSSSGAISVNTTAYSVFRSPLDLNLKFGSLPYSDQLNLQVLVDYYYDRGQKSDFVKFVLHFSNKDGVDRTPPTISGISISNVSSSGYTVTCNVSDNKGVSHVCFPTWTVQNDQDDIFPDWGNTARGSISNGVATYRVNTSDHKNETGCQYVTHIYAWDTSGNQTWADAGVVYVPPKSISVTGVSLNCTSLSMSPGNSYSLSATIYPTNATNKSVTWSSSNTNVATVSGGTVKAVGAGNATITVRTSDGGKTATCAVSVQRASVPVVGVSINPTDLSLTVGATKQITATVYPSNATNKTIRFFSSNISVAFIDSNGILSAAGTGQAVITATTVDGGYTAHLTVKVNAAKPKSIKLNKSGTVKIKKGKTLQLTATVSPVNAITKLTWSSSNKKVATVDKNGKVKAKKKGSATITVKTSNGKKAKVKIKVK